MDNVSEHIFVHRGDLPGELRVSHQERWYVISQTWEDRRIIDTRVIASFATREEADARLKEELTARKEEGKRRTK